MKPAEGALDGRQAPPDVRPASTRGLRTPAAVQNPEAPIAFELETASLQAATTVETELAGEAGVRLDSDLRSAALTGQRAQPMTGIAVPGGPGSGRVDATGLTDAALGTRHADAATQATDVRSAQVMRQVRVAINPALRQATIQLSPPELGRIAIRMKIQRGSLTAVVRAERPETLEILSRHLPELRASLGQQGIEAQNIDLSLDSRGQGTGGADTRDERESSKRFANGGNAQETEPLSVTRTPITSPTDGVDTYA